MDNKSISLLLFITFLFLSIEVPTLIIISFPVASMIPINETQINTNLLVDDSNNLGFNNTINSTVSKQVEIYVVHQLLNDTITD